MNQIVGQHEAEQQAEARAQKRAQLLTRAKSVLLYLSIAAVLGVAFNYRNQLGNMIAARFTTAKPDAGPTGQAAAALNGAKQNAAVRDALIDQISK